MTRCGKRPGEYLSCRPEGQSRKEWQRLCTVIPREWELRLLEAKRVSTYHLAIELLYLHWYGNGKPVTVSSKVAKAAETLCSVEVKRARRA